MALDCSIFRFGILIVNITGTRICVGFFGLELIVSLTEKKKRNPFLFSKLFPPTASHNKRVGPTRSIFLMPCDVAEISLRGMYSNDNIFKYQGKTEVVSFMENWRWRQNVNICHWNLVANRHFDSKCWNNDILGTSVIYLLLF